MPNGTILLKNMDSKMIRKDFQSIKESISITLSLTDSKMYKSIKEQNQKKCSWIKIVVEGF